MPAWLGAAVLGALVYLGVMRPLAGYPVAVGVLATIALGILLRSITTSIWSGQTRYPAEYLGQLGRPIEMMPGLSISGIDIAIIAAALVAMAGFPLLLQRAAVGIEMRGVAENPVLAAQRGINIHSINALSWAAATLMATVAGIFFALKVRLGPDIWYVGLAGFAPALIGGMDSLTRRRDGRASSSRPPKCWLRVTSRRRSRSPRRFWCFWSRFGSGRGASMARARSSSAYEPVHGLPSTLRTNYPQRHRNCSIPGSSVSGPLAGLAAVLLLPLALTNFWTGIANQTSSRSSARWRSICSWARPGRFRSGMPASSPRALSRPRH